MLYVEDVDYLYGEENFIDIYINKCKPVRVINSPNNMPIYTKWSFEFLKEIGKDILVDLAKDPLRRDIVTSKISLNDYINQIENNTTDNYMTGWSYTSTHPYLNDDFLLPSFQPIDFIDNFPNNLNFCRRWIFVGKKAINSDMHVDAFCTNAWLIVVKGQKTLRLVSPIDSTLLHPNDSLFNAATLHKAEISKITIYEMILNPGTIGYVPAGWLHEVRNDEDTLMVTGNFSHGFDLLRFYPVFRKVISKEVEICNQLYTEAIDKIENISIISDETNQAIENEIDNLKKINKENSKKIKTLKRLWKKNIYTKKISEFNSFNGIFSGNDLNEYNFK